ncbi:MAG TPA: hypothetical protein VK750_09505 [Cytophagaceae bacterium]|jgi:hypothetical protein|nr:hypothetical protein [Cytophagaceae bacterium]
MLDPIFLYFIYKESGRLAIEKGYSAARWRTHAFMVWFFGELTGVGIVMTYFPTQQLTMVLIGLSMAYLSYLLLKKYWETLPYNPQDHD